MGGGVWAIQEDSGTTWNLRLHFMYFWAATKNKSANGTQGSRSRRSSDSCPSSKFCLGHLVEVQKNRVTHVGMELARPSQVLL